MKGFSLNLMWHQISAWKERLPWRGTRNFYSLLWNVSHPGLVMPCQGAMAFITKLGCKKFSSASGRDSFWPEFTLTWTDLGRIEWRSAGLLAEIPFLRVVVVRISNIMIFSMKYMITLAKYSQPPIWTRSAVPMGNNLHHQVTVELHFTS